MGDRLTGEEESEQASPKTYGDIFDEFLPEYIAIGMPYDLYWDGEYISKSCNEARTVTDIIYILPEE